MKPPVWILMLPCTENDALMNQFMTCTPNVSKVSVKSLVKARYCIYFAQFITIVLIGGPHYSHEEGYRKFDVWT